MVAPRKVLVAALLRYASRLRFPVLLGLAAGLFLLDLVVPDVIPLVDEILLGVATLLLASWRKQGGEPLDASETPPSGA